MLVINKLFFVFIIFCTLCSYSCTTQKGISKKAAKNYTDTLLLKEIIKPDDFATSMQRKDIPWQLLRVLHRKHDYYFYNKDSINGQIITSKHGNWYELLEYGYCATDSVGFICYKKSNVNCSWPPSFGGVILFKQLRANVFYFSFYYHNYVLSPYQTFWEWRDYWIRELKNKT